MEKIWEYLGTTQKRLDIVLLPEKINITSPVWLTPMKKAEPGKIESHLPQFPVQCLALNGFNLA